MTDMLTAARAGNIRGGSAAQRALGAGGGALQEDLTVAAVGWGWVNLSLHGSAGDSDPNQSQKGERGDKEMQPPKKATS